MREEEQVREVMLVGCCENRIQYKDEGTKVCATVKVKFMDENCY